MSQPILGLDIGGANLKAASSTGRVISLPFPLWKQPDKLPAALARLVAKFPEAAELAVTMTGELCDCYQTKSEGVNSILSAVLSASGSRGIRVWSTEGIFLGLDAARQQFRKVAAANWHALATYACRLTDTGCGLLIDIGTTTADIIPLSHRRPCPKGTTDWDRLRTRELVYLGVRRTPLCALARDGLCAELFATTLDIYLVLGLLPENPTDCDTADGRPATIDFSLARLARMVGADRQVLDDDAIIAFAKSLDAQICRTLEAAIRTVASTGERAQELETVVVSGSGEFLARRILEQLRTQWPPISIVSLNDRLTPQLSACAPAYAVAILAAESPS